MSCAESLWISPPEGGCLRQAVLFCRAGEGIVGDKHADGGLYQVQLASRSILDAPERCSGPCFRRFHANVILDSFPSLTLGTAFRLGEMEGVITALKSCPFPDCPLITCTLKEQTAVAAITVSGTIAAGAALILLPGRRTPEGTGAASKTIL